MITAFLFWFLFGAVLLLLAIIPVYRTKLLYAAQDNSSLLKKLNSLRGLRLQGLFWSLVAVVIYFIIFDLASFGLPTSNFFIEIAFYNFVLITALSLFDAFAVDYLLPAVWKPGFMKTPQEITVDSMIIGVKRQLCDGWVLLIIVSLISAAIYKMMFRNL